MTEHHDQGGSTTVRIELRIGEIIISQKPDSGNIGSSLWDASVILAHYFDTNSKKFDCRMKNKKILELGAGCGLAGIYCALAGGDVTMTDLPSVLPNLSYNVRTNLRRSLDANCKVQEYCWGDPIETLDPPYDVIIACDCVYIESLLEKLIWTLEQLAGPSTSVIICSERRDMATHELYMEKINAIFDIRKVQMRHIHSSYRGDHADLLFCKKKGKKSVSVIEGFGEHFYAHQTEIASPSLFLIYTAKDSSSSLMLNSSSEADDLVSPAQSYTSNFPTSLSFTLFEERIRSRRPVSRGHRRYRAQTSPDYSRLKRYELDLVQAFEAQRSLFFVEQFHSHQRYWQAFRDFVQAQNTNTDRLIVWFTKHLHAYRSFAFELFAVNDAVVGQRKGYTRIAAIRGESQAERHSLSPVLRSISSQRVYRSSSVAAVGSRMFKSMGTSTLNEPVQKGGEILDDLCALDCATARSIEELCDYIEMNVIMRLGTMAVQTSEMVEAIVKEGDRAMTTLQNIDVYTAKAFETCHRTAAGILLAPGEGGPNTTYGSKVGTNHVTTKRSSEVHDMWLADMHYRVASHQQQEAWHNISQLMTKLFDQMRKVEMERKSLTRDLLLDTLDRTNHLWRQLPNLSMQVITFLEDLNVDSDGLEKSIRDGITKHQAGLQDDSRNRRQSTDMRPTPSEADFSDPIGMPLPSPLVIHTAVLERRGEGVVSSIKGGWTTCVVILTADQFLHIFDYKPKDESVVPTPEEAFSDLLPQIDATVSFSGRRDEKCATLLPSLSLDIRFHLVTVRENCTKPIHNCQFWITEIVQNAGLKGFFKGESFRRVLLQTRSQEDRDEWIEKLKTSSISESANSSIPLSAQQVLDMEEDVE